MTQQIKRVIPLDEVAANRHNLEEACLAVIFNHEVVEDQRGVWRWKMNVLMDRFWHGATFYAGSPERPSGTYQGGVELNCLWIDLHHGRFSCEELMKFYMQMGVSLSSFGESFGQTEAAPFWPDARKSGRKRNGYVETPIDYVLRKYRGQVLKL
jgi:hypothetical protein